MFFNSYSTYRTSLLSAPAAFFVLLFSLTTSYAQKTSEINSGMNGNEQILGRVFFPKGDKSGVRPIVKLQSLSSPEITGMADQMGNFRFTHLRPDTYTVIVDGGEAYEKATETVFVGFSGSVPAQGNPGSYAVPVVYETQFYLKYKHGAATPNIAPADVPAAAQELFSQALENARAGDHIKAIERLKAAILQAPEFALAYNELAAEYVKTGQADQAAQILKEAVEILPDDLALRLNYGIALLNQKKFAAAETELRLANQKNSADLPAAGYYLGLALMNQQKIDEAQSVFESVIKNGGDKLALAHKYLGGIYWRNKHYREAADELEKYLKLEPKAADAVKIHSTIKELRHKI
ncbi:MAG TPA: tetratricopeptide repeat protein [Pyrinomonadaceae bacterium]|jgi:Tfp pilus assembly protein PilF|nr:tetratricopeptide repeat protein [Pyrinomonadaceae bacterium]